MRVALYARYSSEHQKESSIVDQYRNCETASRARRLDDHGRYADRAISGHHGRSPELSTDAHGCEDETL